MKSAKTILALLVCVQTGVLTSALAEPELHQDTFQIEMQTSPSGGTIFESRDIIVSVQPKIGGTRIREVQLSALGLLNTARPDIAKIKGVSDQTGPLAINEIREYRFHIPPLERTNVFSHPSLMRFPSGLQSLTVRVHFDQPMVDDDRTQPKMFEMQFLSDDISIAGGGCIGGLIASIFVLAVRFQNQNHVIRFGSAIREIALNVVIGGAAAWILIYLGEITKNLNVGVTLSATSFQGGIIIGLLSYKLGKTLAKGITV